MNRFIIIIVFLSFGIIGCSRMIVSVSIADSDRVHKVSDSLRPRYEASAYANTKNNIFSSNFFDEKKMNTAFEKLVRNSIASGEISKEDDAELLQNFKRNLANETSLIRTMYIQGIKLNENGEFNKANAKFWEASIKSVELEREITTEFPDGAEELINNIQYFNKILVTAPKKNKDNLLGDPLTSYITKNKNENLWESKYNHVRSSTFFGNSDIAVVLTEDPESYNNNYTIKGVRVDADKLIQSSFDLLAQSINVVVSSQGIALPDQGEQNYFYPHVVTAIQNLPTEENKLQELNTEFDAYKKLLLMEILNKDLDKKNGEDLKKAILEIQTIWTSYKAKMEVQLKK